MTVVTSAESGVTAGSKRARIWPSGPTRNFVKFHWISPPVFGFADLSVKYRYSGVLSSPFTETLDIIGNFTFYLDWQNVLISWFVPGSCAPKLFAGIPTITKPRSLYYTSHKPPPAQ